MDAQELRNLQEAYMEVVENQQLDEANRGEQRLGRKGLEPTLVRSNRNLSYSGDSPDLKSDDKMMRDNPQYVSGHRRGGQPNLASKNPRIEAHEKRRGVRTRGSGVREQSDIYDIILSHLLDEGYADTQQAAEAIMVNMSEEWREDIVEANRGDEYATRGMSPEDAKTWKSERRNITRGFGSDVEQQNKMNQEYKRKYGKLPAPDPNYIGSGQRRRQSDTRDNRGKRTTLVHTTSDTLSPSGIRGTITKPEIKIGTPLGGAKNPEPTGKYLRQQQIKNNPYYS